MKFNEYQIKMLEWLMKSKQAEVVQFLSFFVKENYEDHVATKDYIFAKGNIPVCLVAHCDTVFESEKDYFLLYDKEVNIIGSLFKGGFDDKAGVFMIMQLISEGYKPHILFTTDEEVGGIGVRKFVKDYPQCPWEDLKYFIQIDRRGGKDLVTYDCENNEFDQYIEQTSQYFEKNYGSFTDICTLMPAYDIAGCNLSTGYFHEHTRDEYLDVTKWFKIKDAIKLLLDDAKNLERPFEYIEEVYTWRNPAYSGYGYFGFDEEDYYYSPNNYVNKNRCIVCDKLVIKPEEYVPVILDDGGEGRYCTECLDVCVSMTDEVSLCVNCGNWYEKPQWGNDTQICMKCYGGKTIDVKKLFGNSEKI